MKHRGRAVGLHEERRVARARAAFVRASADGCVGGDAERERKIGALPLVSWKGWSLRTIRCHGTSGKGPHDVNVPESLLWSLMSLDWFLCPYHVGDIGDRRLGLLPERKT